MDASLHDDALDLPGYSKHLAPDSEKYTDRCEHVYSLENNKGRKWLSMYVKSRSTSAKLLPLYYEKDIISGRVELDLEKSQTVKGIIISVSAGTISVGQEQELFLNINQDIWNPALGHPTNDRATSPSKLQGRYSWPFAIHLPTKTTVKTPKVSEVFALPPSFSERGSPAYIDYKLIVTIKRSALRVDQILSTNFGYVPVSMPDPSSLLSQMAYRKGIRLVGPDDDPEGWHILPAIKIEATPLCYSVGSSIPLILTLTGSDFHALHLLATTSAIRLHLVRSLALGSSATEGEGAWRSNNHFKESVGRAVFLPSIEAVDEPEKIVIRGKIEVSKALTPSFTFPRFTIRYSLELFPFTVSGFASRDGQAMTPLISENVIIASTATPGVVTHSHAPPGYITPPRNDYTQAVGLLENGNQRFYSHSWRGLS